MHGHSSQPLTRDNLNNHNGGRAAQAYRVSCVRADAARQQLYQLLWTLGRIGPRGQHILKGLDVYIAAPQDVRCRESSMEEPDPNDMQYWEDKLQSYKDRYTPVIQLEEAKGRVYSEMMVLHQFGRDGARALAQDELYIAGPYDVRRAADRCPNAPLEDVCYWDEKWQHFHTVVETLKSACPRVPSPAALTIPGSPAVSYASDDEATNSGRQNKVEAWVHTLQDDANAPPRASTPNTDDGTHTARRYEEAREPIRECLQDPDEGADFVRQYATDQRPDRMQRSQLLSATSKQPAAAEPPRLRKRSHHSAEDESEVSDQPRRSKRLKIRAISSSSVKQSLYQTPASNTTPPEPHNSLGLRRSARLALKPRKHYFD